jgi:hypothetical protein
MKKANSYFWLYSLSALLLLTFSLNQLVAQGPLNNWATEGDGVFEIQENRAQSDLRGVAPSIKLYWKSATNSSAGTFKSPSFTIEKAIQIFDIAGVPGFNSKNQSEFIRLRLRAKKGDVLLRESTTNGYGSLSTERWFTPDLLGKEVYLEIYAPALKTFFGVPDIWMALENYRQADFPTLEDPVDASLQAVEIDEKAALTFCRSIPFLSSDPDLRGKTTRTIKGAVESIPVYAKADELFLLGMINQGWENGVAHWGEHSETLWEREDQVYAGKQLGTMVIQYAEGPADSIPLVFGSNMWFSNHWSHGGSHDVSVPTREPFDSRPEYMSLLRNTLLVKEDLYEASMASDYRHYFLAIKPRPDEISSIELIDDIHTRGRPMISAITLKGKKQKGLHGFKKMKVASSDLETYIDVSNPPDYQSDAAKIAELLYTHGYDMPQNPDEINIPESLDATKIKFLGGKEAIWLSNIWAANLAQIHDKFDPETGYFMETGVDCPFYGGYSGLGTWSTQGIYPAAYSRTSDHFATLAMRHINLPQRETAFVDFCDTWLYFYRNNRDPEKGPPNDLLDLDRYPNDAPPHWSMELSRPPTTGGALNVNEIHGDEEMDGHASTIVGRWYAWRLQGGGNSEWLTQAREDVYGKSRWESTRDAAEFICWLMDYTGRDLVYSEGEFTGWGGIGRDYCLVPKGMSEETDPKKIRENYANANMYEPYPNFACLTALKCAAEMADATGDQEVAEKWRQYAQSIRDAMVRQLVAGDFNNFTWRISPYSVLTTFQDRLVQTWFSLYMEGLDATRWDQEMLAITRNTFDEHMLMPYGHAPVLAMGYGQGWLTHASLLLDEMDHAGKLLVNTAMYTYDKNMDYVNSETGVDWRKWRWIVPEGVNLLPDGSWHRINDLSNGANQGPVMHAIEASAGVDDLDPGHIRIMPRIPDPLEGIEVSNHFVLLPDGDGLKKARIDYRFEKEGLFILSSSESIPKLSIRLGPWSDKQEAEKSMTQITLESGRTRMESSGEYMNQPAWWIWIEGLENTENLSINYINKMMETK